MLRSTLRCGDRGRPLGRVGARHMLRGTWAPRGRVPAGEGIGLRHRRHPYVDAVADDGPTGVLSMTGAEARDRDVASQRDDAWIDGARARVHVGAGGSVSCYPGPQQGVVRSPGGLAVVAREPAVAALDQLAALRKPQAAHS